MRKDAVGVFVDVSRNKSSLGIVGSWASEWRVEVLDKMNDAVPIRSSTCGGGSHNNEYELLKFKTLWKDRKIEYNFIKWLLRVNVKRRIIVNYEIEGSIWVIEDKDLTRILSFGWLACTNLLFRAALTSIFKMSLKFFRSTSKSRQRISDIRCVNLTKFIYCKNDHES